jgi:transposase
MCRSVTPRRQRKPFPDDLPRETIAHLPAHTRCPCCGGAFKPLGEEVSEMLDYIPVQRSAENIATPSVRQTEVGSLAQQDIPQALMTDARLRAGVASSAKSRRRPT